MKLLAIPQVIFGLAIAFFFWTLAGVKAHILPPRPTSDGGIWLDSVPPGATVEFILLGLSLALLICGLFQWKAHIRGAILQTISGLIAVVIFVFLSVRASTINGYGEIYYLAYLSLTLGLAVSVIGITQITVHHKVR